MNTKPRASANGVAASTLPSAQYNAPAFTAFHRSNPAQKGSRAKGANNTAKGGGYSSKSRLAPVGA
jgi:hypothetical protein